MYLPLFLIFLCILLVRSQVSATCYCINQHGIHSDCGGATPCKPANSTDSGYTQCCAPNDTCTPDGFCHFSHIQQGASGWYMGGCTDSSWQDVSCPRECSNFQSQDATYNRTSGLWACCRRNQTDTGLVVDCADPGNETFEAPPPESLLSQTTSTSIAMTGSSSGSQTTIASSTSTAAIVTGTSSSVPSTSQSNTSNNLSTGAKVGIAVGVTVVSVLVLVLGGWTLLRWRKTKSLHELDSRMDEQELREKKENMCWTEGRSMSPGPEELFDIRRDRAELDGVS